MRACPGCHRHVAHHERRCPFCGAPQRTVGATGLLRVLSALSLGLAVVGCGDKDPGETSESTTAGASESGSSSDPATSGVMTSSTDDPYITSGDAYGGPGYYTSSPTTAWTTSAGTAETETESETAGTEGETDATTGTSESGTETETGGESDTGTTTG